MPARDGGERPVPDLEEGGDARLRQVRRAQARDARAEFGGRGGGVAARESADRDEEPRHVVEVSRLRHEDRRAEARDALDVLGAEAVAPDEHQVGLERGDPLDRESRGGAHLRQRARFGRVVAVRAHPHHPRPRPRREHQLGEKRRQRHDPLRLALHLDRPVEVVPQRNWCSD